MNASFSDQNQVISRDYVTVSELNRMVAGLIERNLPMVGVRGEISNFMRAASGHCYFTLKDAGAQVRAVMFRGKAQLLNFSPKEGTKVEAYASASLYQARGDFQLQIESMRQSGAGDLYQEFLKLKAKLQNEGLFDEALKRPIPVRPKAIAVISSAQAAALHDVLITLSRRAPQIPVYVFASLVQGAQAPASLIKALAAANRFAISAKASAGGNPIGLVGGKAEVQVDPAPEVILLVRGGGAIEDLWSFNDETLARAIRASVLPVICGVGHESDVTIADFTADLRAATPTAAAVAASPDRRQEAEAVRFASRGLARVAQRSLERAEQALDLAMRRLRSPLDVLDLQEQKVSALRHRLSVFGRNLSAQEPQIEQLLSRLALSLPRRLLNYEERLQSLQAQLQLVSPQAVLDRGYAILSQEQIIRSPEEIDPSRPVDAQLARGKVRLQLI
jgi:exodeoxyribonuclease VII large subunit